MCSVVSTVERMARISSYVFLDLETTSIPSLDLNKTRITELSMVVVKRRHILDTTPGFLPRVQHKLTMCLNPGRMVDPGATEASGLDNDLLEFETMFNMEVFTTINTFIECQEKPVCLIAENGHDFDFPILKNHFEKLGVGLADNVMCADSLHAFYDILKKCEHNNIVVPSQQDITNSLAKTPEVLQVGIEELTNGSIRKDLRDSYKQEYYKEEETPLSMQLQNETTPKSNKLKITRPKSISQVKRKLFYIGDQKPKESYKLKLIYERVLGRPGIDAHRAENDCVMTAEIATAKAEQFVAWIDDNHCPFTEVKAMKLGVPIK